MICLMTKFKLFLTVQLPICYAKLQILLTIDDVFMGLFGDD